VELPIEDAVPLASAERADARTVDRELRETAARAGALLREMMEGWPAEDRMLVRLRFQSSLSIADISRVLGVPQRPLYRRMDALLARLRDALRAAGIDAAAADHLVSAGSRIDIDFGLAWKNGETYRTNESSGRATAEDQSP
jgi:DNA-directed RNA polymerase specialized sigma24 family protein